MRGRLRTFLREMSRGSTEHAEPIVEPSLSLVWRELTIFAEFLGNIRFARVFAFRA